MSKPIVDQVARGVQAQHDFANGHNCAQAVLLAFAAETGIERAQLYRLSSGLGGGIGGMGHTCGVVNGAALAIGGLLGGQNPEDKEKNAVARATVGRFIKAFESRFGSLTCSGLLGVNVRNDMAREEARAVGVQRLTCPGLLSTAVAMVLEFVNEYHMGMEKKI